MKNLTFLTSEFVLVIVGLRIRRVAHGVVLISSRA